MENLLDFSFINGSILLRLAFAIILGGVIGLEREIHGRPAGLRTHILVCVGATIIMISSKSQAELYFPVSENIRITIDPGRIVAGIMTGIGFLGAGAIIRIGDIVRGVTTAACIWFIAALGIVIGEGFFSLAIVSTASMLGLLMLLQRLEYRLPSNVYRAIQVIAPIHKADTIESSCKTILEKKNIRIQDTSYSFSHEKERFEMTFYVRMKNQLQSGTIIRSLSAIPGITQIKWL